MKSGKVERIAITGASGFLGSHMVQFLKQKKLYVRAILRSANADTKKLYSLADEVKSCDLSDAKKCDLMFKDIDHVYHFAADMGGVGYFSKEQYIPFVSNMQMDLNVMESCRKNGVLRLFYPSSACAYPIDAVTRFKKREKLSETMFVPANPDQMYGWEKLVMLIASEYTPFETRVGVLHTIFGPGQQWEGKRAKFPPAIVYKVIQSKINNTPIHIWGNGKQVRTFLYITDALEKIYRVMNKKGYWGPVNISSDEQVTIKQCVDWLCQYAGIKPKYIYETDKPTGVLLRGVDNKKFNSHYSYRNKTTTKKGFALLYDTIYSQVADRTV